MTDLFVCMYKSGQVESQSIQSTSSVRETLLVNPELCRAAATSYQLPVPDVTPPPPQPPHQAASQESVGLTASSPSHQHQPSPLPTPNKLQEMLRNFTFASAKLKRSPRETEASCVLSNYQTWDKLCIIKLSNLRQTVYYQTIKPVTSCVLSNYQTWDKLCIIIL